MVLQTSLAQQIETLFPALLHKPAAPRGELTFTGVVA